MFLYFQKFSKFKVISFEKNYIANPIFKVAKSKSEGVMCLKWLPNLKILSILLNSEPNLKRVCLPKPKTTP